jgi:hypothetical protein
MLKSHLTKERYYCEECNIKFHQHEPTFILKKTYEIKYKWLELDGLLVKIEKEFKMNMRDSMDLIDFYENVAHSQNLENKESILSQFREFE